MKDDLISKVEQEVAPEQKYRDGIPQITGGLFLVIAMLLMLLGNPSIFVVMIPLLPITIQGLRKRITYPRVGYAQMKEVKANRQALIWLVLAVLIGLLVAFFVMRGSPPSPQVARFIHAAVMYGVALIIVALSVIVFIRKRNTQLIWYAAAILIFVNAALIFKLPKLTVFYLLMGFGALHVIIGVRNMVTFIRTYPVIKDAQ